MPCSWKCLGLFHCGSEGEPSRKHIHEIRSYYEEGGAPYLDCMFHLWYISNLIPSTAYPRVFDHLIHLWITKTDNMRYAKTLKKHLLVWDGQTATTGESDQLLCCVVYTRLYKVGRPPMLCTHASMSIQLNGLSTILAIWKHSNTTVTASKYCTAYWMYILHIRVGQHFNKSPISPDHVPAIQLLHAFSLRNIIAQAIYITLSNNYC